jgi:hypothetical protein
MIECKRLLDKVIKDLSENGTPSLYDNHKHLSSCF